MFFWPSFSLAARSCLRRVGCLTCCAFWMVLWQVWVIRNGDCSIFLTTGALKGFIVPIKPARLVIFLVGLPGTEKHLLYPNQRKGTTYTSISKVFITIVKSS